jgi:hypothetical protein
MPTWRSLTPLGWITAFLTLALSAALLWIVLSAHGHERARAELAAARAEIAMRNRDAAAREAAADARLADADARAALAKELSDAVSPLPDQRPSDRRRALACARLRHQGTDTAALPACDGPEGRTQAPA